MYSILCVRCWLNDQIKQNLTSKSFIPDAARAGKSPCIKNIFYQLYLSLIQILQYMKCMKWSEEDSAEDIVALKKKTNTTSWLFFFLSFSICLAWLQMKINGTPVKTRFSISKLQKPSVFGGFFFIVNMAEIAIADGPLIPAVCFIQVRVLLYYFYQHRRLKYCFVWKVINICF